MRSIALVLLAACGGSSATSTPTTPTTPSGTEEDWRGYLSLLAGPSCHWVGASTFVACQVADSVALIGWEPNNRRYVLWLVDANNVRVFPGIAGNAQWTFESSDGRVTLTRQASGWQLHGETVGRGDVIDAMLATGTPVPVPATPAPGADTDWRSELQAFVGEWTFSGTLGGNPLEYTDTCQWLPSATYVFCRMRGSTNFSLIGWELLNKRFVQYAFASAEPDVFLGTVSNKNWTFTGKGTIALTRTSPLEFAVKATEPDGSVVEGTYSTKPGDVE